MNVVALRRKDGSREFDCLDCGIHTWQHHSVEANGPPICVNCAWMIAQGFDEETKTRMRAIINGEC